MYNTPLYFWSHLLASTQSLRASIVAHPFNVGLGNGSLPKEQFNAYLLQDLPYLNGHASALKLASKRAPDALGRDILMRFAVDTIGLEREIRLSYLKDIPHETSAPAPIVSEFLETLDETVRHAPSFAAALAILVTCPFIYDAMGKAMPKPSPDNRYKPWVDGFKDNVKYTASVDELCEYTQQQVNILHDPRQQAWVKWGFKTGLEFEYNLFNYCCPVEPAPFSRIQPE